MTRSFDYGSVELSGYKNLPLAFAQDDGIFLRVVLLEEIKLLCLTKLICSSMV